VPGSTNNDRYLRLNMSLTAVYFLFEGILVKEVKLSAFTQVWWVKFARICTRWPLYERLVIKVSQCRPTSEAFVICTIAKHSMVCSLSTFSNAAPWAAMMAEILAFVCPAKLNLLLKRIVKWQCIRIEHTTFWLQQGWRLLLLANSLYSSWKYLEIVEFKMWIHHIV